MKSQLLTHFVQTLHLRLDAPMPSELKASHTRISSLRSCLNPAAGAKILQFTKYRNP